MSEMLANRYFQSGRYEEAARQLEVALAKHPERHSVQRKLICCYLMTGRVADAVATTGRLLDAAPGALRGIDPADEGFPCRSPEEAERKLTSVLTDAELHAARALVDLLFEQPGVMAELDLAAQGNPPMVEATELKRILSIHPEIHYA